MANALIDCPRCKTPATLWFEFGSPNDKRSYYRCEPCGLDCAIRQDAADEAEHAANWVQPSSTI